MNKKVLRKNLIETRKNILDKDIKSKIIINKIINLDKYINSKVIALYKSLRDEVNMNYLIDYSLKLGKIVLLPRVIGNDLVFIKINLDTKYEKSDYGILEPIYEIDKVYNDIIDLIIVPGIGFDRKCNRIGYGKGYYDRYLYDKTIYKVGVCFKEQVVNSISKEKNDVKMDMVLTD